MTTEQVVAAPVGAPVAEAAPTVAPATTDSFAAEAPKTFDVSFLKIPEGVTISDTDKATLAEAFVGLPPERAQTLMDLHTAQLQKLVKDSVDANAAAWSSVTTKWRSEIESDPVIGGAQLGQTKASISRLVNEFGDGGSSFREAMNLTGAGNNPAVVRFLAKVSAALYEGKAVKGNPTNDSAPVNMSEIFYGKKG